MKQLQKNDLLRIKEIFQNYKLAIPNTFEEFNKYINKYKDKREFNFKNLKNYYKAKFNKSIITNIFKRNRSQLSSMDNSLNNFVYPTNDSAFDSALDGGFKSRKLYSLLGLSLTGKSRILKQIIKKNKSNANDKIFYIDCLGNSLQFEENLENVTTFHPMYFQEINVYLSQIISKGSLNKKYLIIIDAIDVDLPIGQLKNSKDSMNELMKNILHLKNKLNACIITSSCCYIRNESYKVNDDNPNKLKLVTNYELNNGLNIRVVPDYTIKLYKIMNINKKTVYFESQNTEYFANIYDALKQQTKIIQLNNILN